jgi:uncharacterized protein (DUF1800 family)
MRTAPTDIAIAAHRFGLGEPDLGRLHGDARGWLREQLGAADAQRGSGLLTAAQALHRYHDMLRRQSERGKPAPRAMDREFVDDLRELVGQDVRARLATAASSERPFAERLVLFWSNHFTVSVTKATVRGLAGPFEREAIRPHIAGRFETLLKAAVVHPAMLRYLDNDRSAGPNSPAARPGPRPQTLRRAQMPDDEPKPAARRRGLNENLARELLELHTLGAASARAGVYGQADVGALASLLTGWRVAPAPRDEPDMPMFDPAWHEPGPKVVLGKSYPEGPQALGAVLRDLAAHPATGRFIAFKLARHFVADNPPPALVENLADTYRRSDGDLSELYRALIDAPQAWEPQPAKLKTPEEFVLSAARLLGMGARAFEREPDGGMRELGQRPQGAPSPAGWPDRAEDWLGPEAVWKRIEWSARIAERGGRETDARALARASLGPWLSASTAQQIERAADGSQAVALLLMAPEFQRR